MRKLLMQILKKNRTKNEESSAEKKDNEDKNSETSSEEKVPAKNNEQVKTKREMWFAS